MATYASVIWQPDDELTSAKLNQMAQNEEWLKQNAITGTNNYRENDNISPFMRTPGSETVNVIQGLYVPFDSGGLSVMYWPVTINYNPVFAFPPIVVVSLSQGQSMNYNPVVYQDFSTTQAKVTVFNADGISSPMHGALNVILLGRSS